jgi:hypothetical protein
MNQERYAGVIMSSRLKRKTAEGNQLGWVANEDLGPAPKTAANR